MQDLGRNHYKQVYTFTVYLQPFRGFISSFKLCFASTLQSLILFQGITQEHLDMLGPIICQTIRPLVFKAGLWTIEVEKSWTHLFDMVATLMKVRLCSEISSGQGLKTKCCILVSIPHIFYFCLLQRGYPGGAEECNRSTIYGPTFFPTLTHTLILKDTWVLIVEQMHELGLDTFLKLFRLSANLRYSKNIFYLYIAITKLET